MESIMFLHGQHTLFQRQAQDIEIFSIYRVLEFFGLLSFLTTSGFFFKIGMNTAR